MVEQSTINLTKNIVHDFMIRYSELFEQKIELMKKLHDIDIEIHKVVVSIDQELMGL